MKIFKLFAFAVALITASAASAEVVSSVYDFENYPEGQPNIIIDGGLQTGNNIKTTDGSAYKTLTAAGHEYTQDGGLLVATMLNINDAHVANLKAGMNIIDMGGNTGKVLAIVGTDNVSELNQALQNRGIDRTLAANPAGFPFWDLHFFLDPETPFVNGQNYKVTITMSILHKNEASHCMNNIHIKSDDGSLTKPNDANGYTDKYFSNPGDLCYGHNDFRFDDWTECSIVFPGGKLNPYKISIGFKNWGGFQNSAVLIKNLIVETTNEACSEAPVFKHVTHTVGMAFNERSVSIQKGESYTNALKYVAGTPALTYTSSNTSVATVDATGKIKAVGSGMAVISAKPTDENNINPEATYIVYVSDDDDNNEYFSFYDEFAEIPTDGYVDITLNGTKWENNHLVLDLGSSIDIAAREDYEITKVLFNCDALPRYMRERSGDCEIFEVSEYRYATWAAKDGKWLNNLSFYCDDASNISKVRNVAVTYSPLPEANATFELGERSILASVHPAHALYYKIESIAAQQAPARVTYYSAGDEANSEDLSDWTKVDGNAFSYEPEKGVQPHYVKFLAVDHKGNQSKITTYKVSDGGITTGLNVIEIDDNVPAVYYNMQGMRVEKPVNGLYIEVKGNTSRKVSF